MWILCKCLPRWWMSGLSFPKVGSHDKFVDFRIGIGKIHDFSEEPSVYLPFFLKYMLTFCQTWNLKGLWNEWSVILNMACWVDLRQLHGCLPHWLHLEPTTLHYLKVHVDSIWSLTTRTRRVFLKPRWGVYNTLYVKEHTFFQTWNREGLKKLIKLFSILHEMLLLRNFTKINLIRFIYSTFPKVGSHDKYKGNFRNHREIFSKFLCEIHDTFWRIWDLVCLTKWIKLFSILHDELLLGNFMKVYLFRFIFRKLMSNRWSELHVHSVWSLTTTKLSATIHQLELASRTTKHLIPHKHTKNYFP